MSMANNDYHENKDMLQLLLLLVFSWYKKKSLSAQHFQF